MRSIWPASAKQETAAEKASRSSRGDEERRYAVTVKDDGVYLNTGFILIVR